MISTILKTLSDTEIMAVANQLASTDLDEQLLYRQIVAKGNNGETTDEMFKELNQDNFRGTLPRLVAVELADRYKNVIGSTKPTEDYIPWFLQ
jgi:hypothetical protein